MVLINYTAQNIKNSSIWQTNETIGIQPTSKNLNKNKWQNYSYIVRSSVCKDLYHSLMLFICNKNNMSPSLVVLCLMVTNLYLSVFVVSFVNDNHVREFVNNV
jgi:hypothetical protein